MDTVILVAHGSQRSGAFSNPKIKIITKAGQALTFAEAKVYLNGGAAPEFASSSLGDYEPLSDDDCRGLFGVVPGAGPGYVNTGKRRGGDTAGYQIFAMRGMNASFADIATNFAKSYNKVILVACRN
jgi:hypothetical protein